MNGKEEVWSSVEEFRSKHLKGIAGALPVDVFSLVELELRLDVVPFDDLLSKYRVDAALMQDFSGIYVDAEAYVLLERGPIWKQKRLRFSVAHELGHFWMHRTVADKRVFATLAEFSRWLNEPQPGQLYTLEQTANEFAGRLLVPVDRLIQDFDKLTRQFDAIGINWKQPGMRHSFAEKIADGYGVNCQVIEARLDREGIWPAQ